jgi:hypothetical protein
MAALKNDILPAAIYNTLPHIHNMEEIPVKHAHDIYDLSALMKKYNLGDRVRIKLVHIHFQLKEGEVFAARDVVVPKIGACNIMQAVPVQLFQPLYPHHYFVNDNGDLAAYEYMSQPGPDLSQHPAFVHEFCQFVRERSLQRTLGLSLRHSDRLIATNELEYPEKRVCIDVPTEVPLPDQLNSTDTTTEFVTSLITEAERDHAGKCSSYTSHHHCSTYRKRHRYDVAEEASFKSAGSEEPSNDQTSFGSDSGDGDTTGSSDDSDSSSSVNHDSSDDSDFEEGLSVTNGISREIKLAGLKLDPGAGLYKVVSCVSDNA